MLRPVPMLGLMSTSLNGIRVPEGFQRAVKCIYCVNVALLLTGVGTMLFGSATALHAFLSLFVVCGVGCVAVFGVFVYWNHYVNVRLHCNNNNEDADARASVSTTSLSSESLPLLEDFEEYLEVEPARFF